MLSWILDHINATLEGRNRLGASVYLWWNCIFWTLWLAVVNKFRNLLADPDISKELRAQYTESLQEAKQNLARYTERLEEQKSI